MLYVFGLILVTMIPENTGTTHINRNSFIESCGINVEGWMYHNHACYKYVDKKYSFKQASEYCQGFIGGEADLMTIASDSENEYIMTTHFRKEYIWLGLEVNGRNNRSHWINSDLDGGGYRNWLYGHPPFRHGKCAIMTHSGRWIDTNCDRKFPFVCKKVSTAPEHNRNQRIIIVTAVPTVMIIFMIIFVMCMIQRSRNEIQLLQKEIGAEETLHLILTHKDPIQRLEDIKHRRPSDMKTIYAEKALEYSAALSTDSPITRAIKSTGRRAEGLENILKNSSLRKKKKRTAQSIPAVLELLSPVEVKPIKCKGKKKKDKDNKIFYVHDEILSNRHVSETSLDSRFGAIKRMDSDISGRRRKPLYQSALHPSSSRTSLGESSTSSFSGNTRPLTDSGVLDLDNITTSITTSVIKNNYKSSINDDGFVEVTLF